MIYTEKISPFLICIISFFFGRIGGRWDEAAVEGNEKRDNAMKQEIEDVKDKRLKQHTLCIFSL